MASQSHHVEVKKIEIVGLFTLFHWKSCRYFSCSAKLPRRESEGKKMPYVRNASRPIQPTVFVSFSLLILCTCVGVQGQQIVWQRDIQRAVDESARSGRPLLIKASTDWCHYCKKMQRETFSDKRIASHVNACFIPVYVDGDVHKGLIKQLGIRSYPTTVVVSPQMQVVSKIQGYRTVSQLSKDLSRICNHQSGPTRKVATKTPAIRQSVFGNLCPVSPIEVGEFTAGKNEYSASFRGYQIQFASEEAMSKFQATPEKYWPIADGNCVVAMRAQQPSSGDLKHGAIYQGRVWLFSSAQSKSDFEANPQSYAAWFHQVASRRNSANSRSNGERAMQPQSLSR